MDDDSYPLPNATDVSTVSKNIWWHGGAAFGDHCPVFLDLAGDTDYLYDPSFPSGSAATVTYFGSTGIKTFNGSSNFMTNYFETSCPYLFGLIHINYGPGTEWLHIHTNDFDRPGGIDPDDIKFVWVQY